MQLNELRFGEEEEDEEFDLLNAVMLLSEAADHIKVVRAELKKTNTRRAKMISDDLESFLAEIELFIEGTE